MQLAGADDVGTAHTTLAVVLAFGSALLFAVALVGQQRAAAESSDADARTGRFIVQLLRNPRWIAATVGDWGGYVLQAVALGLGSVLVVQPILVTSLLFALPLGAYLARRKLGRGAAVAGALLTVSLAVFLVLADPNAGQKHGSRGGWLVVAALVVPLVTLCLVGASRRSGATRASLIAITVGVLGGVLSVLTKAVAGEVGNGLWHLLAVGETYGLAVVGLAGIYLQQLAFQAGSLQSSLPIMIVLEPVVAVSLGVTLLDEKVQASGVQIAVIVLCAVVMTIATIALARDRARADDAAPAATDRIPARGETA